MPYTIEIPVCEIPAGEYPIGNNSVYLSRAEHTVSLPAFAIGQTTVTNAQFAPFIDAGGYTNERLWTDLGWRWQKYEKVRQPAFWTDENFNQPDQPIVGVTWYETIAFVNWLAEETQLPWRLPSEAAWEAAARGPEGEAPMPRHYNTVERGLGRAWPVTERGNTSWCGAYDMCGNVWEWCSSRWGRSWQNLEYKYPYTKEDGRENLSGSHARIIRGGSWYNPIIEANPANRDRYLPGSRASNIGFRLARNL